MGILTVITILMKCRQSQIKIDVKSESDQDEQNNVATRSALMLEHSTAASQKRESTATVIKTVNELMATRPIISEQARTG